MSIALAKNYLPLLDEIYKRESLTSIFDAGENDVKFVGANKANFYKMTLQGFGDYSRSTGFVTGTESSTWEELTLAYDRGRSFTVDAMDDEESLGMAFGRLAGEFIRTKEVPELDAYRFAKWASASSIGAATPADLASVTNILTAIDDAQGAMDDEEVPYEGRVLFISAKAYVALKGKLTREYKNENGIDRNIEMLDDLRVIRVPQARFNTAIELLDGTSSGETDGGYSNVPSSGSSYKINFMIVHPSAILQVNKHRVPRIWTPAENINADAYKFDLRAYGDSFVLDNKVKGIYLHRYATANS